MCTVVTTRRQPKMMLMLEMFIASVGATQLSWRSCKTLISSDCFIDAL